MGYFLVLQRSTGEQAAAVALPTLSAVELVPSVDAVGLTVAHEQWMQRTAAPAGLGGPCCENIGR